jgi:hypothetical protein
MGLLDDAIREHLDLKRRRGADPADIERAEREALGPVRRGPEPEAASDEPSAYDLGPEPDWDDEPLQDEVRAPGNGDAYAEPAGPTEVHDLAADLSPPAFSHPPERQVDDAFVDDPLADDPFSAGDEAAVPPPHPAPGSSAPAPDPAPDAEATGGETVEYHVEEAFRSAGAGEHPAEGERPAEGEDPLEETPEFLQDTPDHDRLWFEQRPPRDFDFDG